MSEALDFGRLKEGDSMKPVYAVLLMLASLTQAQIPFDYDIAAGPFEPTRESLAKHYVCPEWFRDAKFGIYMHWGLNSVSGFNGHYARFMYHQHDPNKAGSGWASWGAEVYPFHVENYGHPSEFGYKDFIPLWKAEKFDALALAKLYKVVGARYIGVMAVHCDNFDCYDSSYQPWNSVRMGPKIDIVKAWKDACEELQLRFAITSHSSTGFHEHAFYQGETDTTGPRAGVPYDTVDPRYEGLYGQRTPDRMRRTLPEFGLSWYRRTKELVDKYDPDLLYFDGALPQGDFGLHIAAHYYNSNLKTRGRLEGVLTVKNQSKPLPGFTVDVEAGGVRDMMPDPWQVDTSINPGWFYMGGHLATLQGDNDAGMSVGVASDKGPDQIRMNAGQVIDNLVDIVSKNGNMMLNVGLRPDGSLPETFRHELLDIGKWLQANGEAIYETRPHAVFGEGPSELDLSTHYNDNAYTYTAQDLRFTRRGRTLYAIFMDWPGNGAKATIRSLRSRQQTRVRSVTMLASGERLRWRQDETGLHVTLPSTQVGEFAYVLKVEH